MPLTDRPIATYIARSGLFEDDWRVRVTRTRPWPVVLVHGTGHLKGVWEQLGGELRADGWATFAPDYGDRASKPLRESYDRLSAYVDQVIQATGAERAILVGHSQGGLLATLLSLAEPDRFRHVVCLAAPNHGTLPGGERFGIMRFPQVRELAETIIHGYWGQSGLEQLAGSPVVERVTSRGELPPDVTYTCIASRTDQLVRPPSSCFLEDGGTGQVENIMIQDRLPRAIVLHEDLPRDARVRRMVREALLKLVREELDDARP